MRVNALFEKRSCIHLETALEGRYRFPTQGYAKASAHVLQIVISVLNGVKSLKWST